MLRSLPLLALLAIATVCAPAPAAAQQSAGQQLRLVDDALYRADLFYYEGDYYRAITQYKIFLMGNPPADQADAVRLKIAWMYLESDKLAAAADLLKQIRQARPPEDRLAVWARIYYADVASRARQGAVAVREYEALYEDCDALARRGVDKQTPDAIGPGDCVYLRSYARLGLARHYARVHDFDDSIAALRDLPEASPLKPKAEAIATHVEGLRVPRKRPALAGALSIVPGLGHFYIEEYGAGVWAMAFNGAFIYAFVDSLAARKYGQATLIGVVELIWYSGTIFGAVSGAHRFNRDARRIVEDGITDDLDVIDDPEPWPSRFPIQRPALELEWEWQF